MATTLEKELAKRIIQGVGYDTATAAIAGAATINLIATPGAGKRLELWRLWIGDSNTHGSEVGTATVQDTDATKLAQVQVHFATSVNGFVEFDGFKVTTNKGLDVVIASGTQAGRVVAYYRVVDA